MSKPGFGFAGFSLAQTKKPKLSAFGDDDATAFKPKEVKEEPAAANVKNFLL